MIQGFNMQEQRKVYTPSSPWHDWHFSRISVSVGRMHCFTSLPTALREDVRRDATMD